MVATREQVDAVRREMLERVPGASLQDAIRWGHKRLCVMEGYLAFLGNQDHAADLAGVAEALEAHAELVAEYARLLRGKT